VLGRLVLAVVVAVFVGLVCVALLGPLLLMIAAPVAQIVGEFLITWGWILGLLAGLWLFFSGASIGIPWRR
jgi:hypothetical protein